MNDEAARRRKLIEATIATLAEVGFPAASLSEIARRAQVSTGLFAHYFGDKDGLLEATLRFMAARLSTAAARRLRVAATPVDRLYAICDAALADEEFDRPTGAVWLAFWGQVAHSPRYQRVQRLYERRMASNLRHALRGLAPAEKIETAAALIAAAIDGLWLRARASGPGDGAAARRLMREMIDALLARPPDLPKRGRAIAAPASEAWRTLDAHERATRLHAAAEALRDAAPALARLETGATRRPIRATLADAAECARAFEAAAAFAMTLRRVRWEGAKGRVDEHGQAPGRAMTASAHWSRPLLDLGGAGFRLARGDSVQVDAEAMAFPVLAEAVAVIVKSGLPSEALTVRTLPPDARPATARFGFAGPKAAVVVLADAPLDLAARAAFRGGRAWSGSTYASQCPVYAPRAMLRRLGEACAAAAAELRLGDPLDPATDIGPLGAPGQAEWVAQLRAADLRDGARGIAGGAADGPQVVVAANGEARLVRASTFAPILTLIPFDNDGDLAAELDRAGAAPALGVFGGDFERARALIAALDRPVTFVNDDGLGPLLWPSPDFGPFRRIFWGEPR